MFFSLFVYSEIAKALLILQNVIIVLPFARFVDVNAPVSRDSVNFTKLVCAYCQAAKSYVRTKHVIYLNLSLPGFIFSLQGHKIVFFFFCLCRT